MSVDRWFLGLPVTGAYGFEDIRYRPPRPLSELAPLFRAVLDDEGVAEFGWRQADPRDDPFDDYVGDVWFRAEGDADGSDLSGHPTIGPGRRYDRCAALESALYSGGFDDALREGLCDEGEVRVSRSVITVTELADD